MNQLSLDISSFAYKLTIAVERFLSRVADSRKASIIVKSTARELNALTDRELSDIGITRGDIDEIARQQARMR